MAMLKWTDGLLNKPLYYIRLPLHARIEGSGLTMGHRYPGRQPDV